MDDRIPDLSIKVNCANPKAAQNLVLELKHAHLIGQKFDRIFSAGRGVILEPFSQNREIVVPKPIIELDFIPRLNLRERRYRRTPEAVVVCGAAGKKLTAQFIKEYPKAGGWHALFNIPGTGIEVVADPTQKEVKIFQHQIITNPDSSSVRVETRLRWEGDYDDRIPTHCSVYLDAVNAAIEKSECLRCTCLHYANLPVKR